MDQYKLNYNAATIKARLQNSTNPILCPLITSGASGTRSRLYYDSQTHGTNNGNLFWHTGGGSNQNGVYWEDLKYAIRLYEIIEAITVRYPSLVFTDDFFSTGNPEFYNLYMWLHRKKGSVAPSEQITTFPVLVDGFGVPAPTNRTSMVNGSGLVIYGTDLPSITQQLTLDPNTASNSTPCLLYTSPSPRD